MLSAIDLTPRQATRLLQQAIRTQAQLDVEPRNWPDGDVLHGALVGREANLLLIELSDAPDGHSIVELMGAFCEVRSTLSGQVFLFTTCVLDMVETEGSTRIKIAIPDAIQVANRRKYERTNTTVASHVRMWSAKQRVPSAGLLANISPEGMACNFPGASLDDAVLVGDDVRVSFELAGFDEVFELPAVVCNKHNSHETHTLLIGLAFKVEPGDLVAQHTLDRVHGMLNELTVDLGREEG